MRISRTIAAVLALAAAPLSAQSGTSQPASGQWRFDTDADLSATLDCFEAAGQTVIAAHRGGPTPGLPENSIEAMDALLHAVPAIMEVDVAVSSDGMLFLLHDDTLDRTTNLTGEAAALDWRALSQARLRDEAGWVTPYRIPTLEQALRWAKDRTVLEIDFKRDTPRDEVIAMIRAEGMAQGVVLIAYSLEQAKELHALAPEMLVSYSMERPSALDEAVAAGIPADRLLAFTGIRTPRPELYRMLDDADVEVIFGTLGGRNSIDNLLDRYGIDARYAELGEEGVDIIATDRPRAAGEVLAKAKRLQQAGQCGVSRSAE